MMYSGFLDLVGKTPVVQLRSRDFTELNHVNLCAKLEFYNPTGSIKDRPAAFIIRKLLVNGEIDPGTTIIESSSGNFGVALSAVCSAEGLRFVCVVDPLILGSNEYLLGQFNAQIVKVSTPDDSGGYLKARIAKVHELVAQIPNARWINQYENAYNAQSHYFGTGMEIYKSFADVGLDYVFVAVSSGGTITGVSQLLKEHFPHVTIVAVDASGSVIFGGPAKRRHIPGMGSSIIPGLLKDAKIDEVVHVEEVDIVRGCTDLLHWFGLFVGGSSGAVFSAARQYFARRAADATLRPARYPQVYRSDGPAKPNVLLLFADRGERYISTIYSPRWLDETFPQLAGHAGRPSPLLM